MLSKEQQFILDTLSDFVNCRKSLPNDVDWSVVWEIADVQQVVPIIYYQHENHIPKDLFAKFKTAYFAHLSSVLNRQETLEEIDKSFNMQKIDYLYFKGFKIAKYYPKPDLRTMGDCDILVRPGTLNKAKHLLEDLGFNKVSEYYESVYEYKKLKYELHDHLLFDEIVNTDADISFCNKAWDYANSESDYKYILDDSFHLAYLIVHLKKHLTNKGVGLRQFVDIYLFFKYANINDELFHKFLKELNLEKFYDVIVSLCSRWFEGTNQNSLSQKFFEEASEQIFNFGVFGHQNVAKQEFVSYNRKKEYGKLGSIVSFAFPSYEVMRHSEYYTYIDGKPFLLPAAWFYRFIRLVVNKRLKEQKDFVKNTISDDFDKKHDENLKSWGLMD